MTRGHQRSKIKNKGQILKYIESRQIIYENEALGMFSRSLEVMQTWTPRLRGRFQMLGVFTNVHLTLKMRQNYVALFAKILLQLHSCFEYLMLKIDQTYSDCGSELMIYTSKIF